MRESERKIRKVQGYTIKIKGERSREIYRMEIEREIEKEIQRKRERKRMLSGK